MSSLRLSQNMLNYIFYHNAKPTVLMFNDVLVSGWQSRRDEIMVKKWMGIILDKPRWGDIIDIIKLN